MDITDAIVAIQVHWRAVDGIRQGAAPDEPDDSVGIFPRVLTYDAYNETDISKMYSGTWSEQKGTLRSDLLLSRTNLKGVTKQGRDMCRTFLLRLKDDPNLGGTIMMASPIRCSFMTFRYAAIDYIGWRVEMDYQLELTT